MTLSNQHTSVLIIGAGPSGLMMAAQLLRYGVQPIIIDSGNGPTNESRALAVQARTLEIYRQMGIIKPVIAAGKPAQGLQFNYRGELKAELPITDIGNGQTPYPYILIYPQNKNERVLLNELTQHTLPVYWNTTLIALSQNPSSVTATLKTNNTDVTITADWLIGADGARSIVRKELNIPFKGDTYQHRFYLADIVTDHDDNFINTYLNKQGFAAFFPTDEKNAYRLIGNLPPGLEQEENLKLDNVMPFTKSIMQNELTVKKCNWFTIYKLHHRMAEEFRSGRCFLIGDAAHIHSPVGGQGMNTGLQDAYNLAWKLAGVINNKLKAEILDTYAAERMPVARQLLRTMDRAFSLVMSARWTSRLLKRYILPKLLSLLWSSASIKSKFFKVISQTGIDYRHSNINLHLSQATYIKAGDRLPYYKLYDVKKQTETDLHAWCSKPGFTLIIMGYVAEHDLLSYARWITNFYGSGLNFFYLPFSKQNRHIFNAFEVKSGHNKTVIVRPDNYIGFIADTTDIDIINNYLRQTTYYKRLINS